MHILVKKKLLFVSRNFQILKKVILGFLANILSLPEGHFQVQSFDSGNLLAQPMQQQKYSAGKTN